MYHFRPHNKEVNILATDDTRAHYNAIILFDLRLLDQLIYLPRLMANNAPGDMGSRARIKVALGY